MSKKKKYNFAKPLIYDTCIKLLETYERLYAKIPTTLWISDLHGDGERFIKVLHGRFGLLYTTCQEALKTDNELLIKSLTRVIRRKYWGEDLIFNKQECLIYLIQILKYKLEDKPEINHHIQDHKLTVSLLKTVHSGKIPNKLIEEEELFQFIVKDISECILFAIPDKIIILGDIFDRGASPDKIARILKFPFYKERLSIIWGNHDILWLGAGAQNKSMIAEALRITCKYGHLSFLTRLNIDISRLNKFAAKTYKKITGNFRSESLELKRMEKALAIIQFKLEEQAIKANPQFNMESRLWLEKLSKLLSSGNCETLTDVDFPTIDLKNPTALSKEENDIINDLANQFKNSTSLKNILELFINKASIYKVYQDILNIHALVPSTKDGKYEQLMGYKGKNLLDYIDQLIKRVGNNYLKNRSQNNFDLDFLFYLWCGPKSPLFGKDAMKTFERYFLKNKKTHKEKILHWNKNLDNVKFRNLLKKEFNINRIIFGHIPRDIRKGDKMSIADGFAINIDGGFAGAYLERGHALVRSPYMLYAIVLPTAEDAKLTVNEDQSIPALIEIIEKNDQAHLYADIAEGYKIKIEADKLLNEIYNLKKKFELT